MAGEQQFCLRWNNHQSTLVAVFDSLLENSVLVDCTLAADGQQLKAHKVVLSACSPYLENLLSQHYDKHPIIILKDVKYSELKAMLDYMYRGEVNISQEQLGSFLKAAESLQIKGLTDSGGCGIGDMSNKQLETSRKQTTSIAQPAAISTIVNNHTRVSSQTVPEERKQNLSIPTHVLDSRSQSPLLQREGSVSPTIRKRKKLNSLNKSDAKLVKTFSNDSLNASKVNECRMDLQPLPSQIISSSNVPSAPSPPVNMAIVKSEPDVLPLSNKTEFKQNINDNIVSAVNENELHNDENNENLYEENTSNTTSPGPSHHYLSQSYSEKSTMGDNSNEMLLQSDDMQSSNQGTLGADRKYECVSFFFNCTNTNKKLVIQMILRKLRKYNSQSLGNKHFSVCHRCGKIYPKLEFTSHVNSGCRINPILICPFCGSEYSKERGLQSHIVSIHKNEVLGVYFVDTNDKIISKIII